MSEDGWADEDADPGAAEGNESHARSDEPMTDTVDADDGGEHREAEETTERDAGADEGRNVRRTLNYVLLAGLSLLALIATLQLYFNVSSAINQWISREYRSLFQAAFNLVVLLLVGSAMVWQVRRLRE
jgi:hypothetical protein